MNFRWQHWAGVAGFVLCTTIVGFYLVTPTDAGGQTNKPVVSVVEGSEVNLAFKQPGSIAQLHVAEGDIVEAGQLVATISSEELLAKREQAVAAIELAKTKQAQAQKGVVVTDEAINAQIKQAEAAVNAAKAQYEANKNGARPEEIAQLKAKVEATRTVKEAAQANLERMQILLDEGAIAQAKMEEVTAQYEQAVAELTASEQQLEMAQKGARAEQLDASRAQLEQAQAKYAEALAARGQVDVKNLDVQSAEASIQQAKGALAEIDAYLENTSLYAPLGGVVKSVSVKQGELVSQGFTVMSLQVFDDKYVKFYVDETSLGGLRVGDSQSLYLPALDKTVEGKVQTIAPAADFAVKKASQNFGDRDMRAFQVKLTVNDEDVLPGYTVEWNIKGASSGE